MAKLTYKMSEDECLTACVNIDYANHHYGKKILKGSVPYINSFSCVHECPYFIEKSGSNTLYCSFTRGDKRYFDVKEKP